MLESLTEEKRNWQEARKAIGEEAAELQKLKLWSVDVFETLQIHCLGRQ